MHSQHPVQRIPLSTIYSIPLTFSLLLSKELSAMCCQLGTCPALFTPPQKYLKLTISINPHPISPSFPFPLDSHILPANNTLPEVPIYKFHRAPNGTVLYTTIEKPRAQKQHHVLVTNTRPPLAGPFAFSRIPRPHRDIPRLFLSQEIQNTWLFDNTYSG